MSIELVLKSYLEDNYDTSAQVDGKINDEVFDINDKFAEIDQKLDNISPIDGFKPQDPVNTYNDLLNIVSGFGEDEKNYVWMIINDPNPDYNQKTFIWNGERLVQITGVTDLSEYQKTTIADSKYAFKTDLDNYVTSLQLTNVTNPISASVDSVSSLLNLTIGNLGDTDQRVNNLEDQINNIPDEVSFSTQDTIYSTGIEVASVTGDITHYLVDMNELQAHANHDAQIYQGKLTAGTNITIDSDNVISSTGGGSSSNVTYNNGILTIDGTQVNNLTVSQINATDIHVSELVESDYGILADGFLQNGEGKDYALQEYVDDAINNLNIPDLSSYQTTLEADNKYSTIVNLEVTDEKIDNLVDEINNRPILISRIVISSQVIYQWKGDTTTLFIAKNVTNPESLPNVVYDPTTDVTGYAFVGSPITIKFYIGSEEETNVYYSDAILSPPATFGYVDNAITEVENSISTDYIKKTDIIVDNTPIENSNNFVTSGGVYDFTNNKADKFTINPLTGPEITVGMNLSNKELVFGLADDISWNPANFNWITFTDGSRITWISASYAWQYIDINDTDTTLIVEGGNYWTVNSILFGDNKIVSEIINPGDSEFINDSHLSGDSKIMNLIDVQDNLDEHIEGDEERWQTVLDSQVSLEARLKAYIQQVISGSTPIYDYTQPVTIIGTDGLINLATTPEWTATANGAITCQVGGLLGVAMLVYVNDSLVWTSPVTVLGISISGDANPSPEIPINSGDTISVVGVLGVGQTLNITFYPRIA